MSIDSNLTLAPPALATETRTERSRRVRFVSFLRSLLIALIAIAVFYPVVQRAVFTTVGVSADFIGYVPFIRHIREWSMVTRPNFLYPLIVSLLSPTTLTAQLLDVQLFVTLCFYGVLAVVILDVLRQSLGIDRTWQDYLFYLALTLALMIIAPVSFLPLPRHNLYFGYIGITVYHNANIAVCRPLALLHFWRYTRQWTDEVSDVEKWLWMPCLLVLTALAKPNYAMALIPCVVIFAILDAWNRRRNIRWNLVLPVLLPSVAILGWQFAFTYVFPNPDIRPNHIAFMPFAAYREHSLNLVPKFILSIIFPAAVLLMYRKEILKWTVYQLALLFFLVSLVFNYGFAEAGASIGDGNFYWSGQLGLFFICVVSVLWVLWNVRHHADKSWKLPIIGTAFLLHVTAGIIWYFSEATAPGQHW